ncbi:MAG: hypothetical protein JNM72_06730, partial [Deltaproteobacteria bacterium]|nr:hypothetical protein [Deltaproteobacteria bacterium]
MTAHRRRLWPSASPPRRAARLLLGVVLAALSVGGLAGPTASAQAPTAAPVVPAAAAPVVPVTAAPVVPAAAPPAVPAASPPAVTAAAGPSAPGAPTVADPRLPAEPTAPRVAGPALPAPAPSPAPAASTPTDPAAPPVAAPPARDPLEERLLGPDPGPSEEASPPRVAPSPLPTPAWAVALAVGLIFAFAVGKLIERRRRAVAPAALRVVSTTTLGRDGGLSVVEVKDADGTLRRLLIGHGGGAPRLVVELDQGADFEARLGQAEAAPRPAEVARPAAARPAEARPVEGRPTPRV